MPTKLDGRIEDWEFIHAYSDNLVVRGSIYDFTPGRFREGEIVTTSPIKYVDLTTGFIQTKNSKYKLGQAKNGQVDFNKG